MRNLSLVLLFLTGIGTAFAAANFQFQATDVHYLARQREDASIVRGIISNAESSAGKLFWAELNVKCRGGRGGLCVNDNAQFNTDITLNAGQAVIWEFEINNSNNTRYHEPWKWDVKNELNWTNF